MPFGKANSSKIFCFWVKNWCEAFTQLFSKNVQWPFVIRSYVDDIFGGAHEKEQARKLKNEIIATGLATTAIANLDKCHGPAQNLSILGMTFDAITKRITLPSKKQQKYLSKLRDVLTRGHTTSKELEKIVGYLVWASYAEPFGRPFISAASNLISRDKPHTRVEIRDDLETALKIWVTILKRNEGVSFNYILNKMPQSRDEWFVDASTSWGIGGCAGNHYFSIPNTALTDLYSLFSTYQTGDNPATLYGELPIAYIELIAVVVAVSVFSQLYKKTLLFLNSDNTDVVAWLRKGRCRRGIGFKTLAAIEYFKREHGLKISPRHIPGRHNNTADCLSRGSIPEWLIRNGTLLRANIPSLSRIIHSPLEFWSSRY